MSEEGDIILSFWVRRERRSDNCLLYLEYTHTHIYTHTHTHPDLFYIYIKQVGFSRKGSVCCTNSTVGIGSDFRKERKKYL